MSQYGFYIDTSRCTGCNACVVACKQWHDIEPGPAKPVRVYQWEKGAFPNIDVRVLPIMCFHCQNPKCIEACENNAIYKEDKYGAVLVDPDKCQGDRHCYEACPYGSPQFKSDDPDEKMLKCNMCYDRLEEGLSPICVLSCSLRALDFGPLEELKARYGDEGSYIGQLEPPCKNACPAGINAQEYINLAAAGKYEEALTALHQTTPFVGVLGRVCTRACEIDCFRGRFDDAVSIREIKRFVADYALKNNLKPPIASLAANEHQIAVVGAGPSGLACAYTLAQRGYQVTIYEAMPQAGGMMRYGIPEYRLPREILNQEIALVESLGVKINTNTPVKNLDELFAAGFQAVYVATGAGEGLKLKVPGSEAQGITSAIDFLQAVNTGAKPDLGKKVAVIGGGSVAMDAARSALRLGVQEVHVICLERLDFKCKDHMNAQEEEVREAQEEGIIFHPGHGIQAFAVENGRVCKVLCNDCLSVKEMDGSFNPQCVKPAEAYEVEADSVLVAIGQRSAATAYPQGLPLNGQGRVTVTGSFQTADPRIFAGGDLLSGPLDIISAIAAGNEAAESIDRYCRGEDVNQNRYQIPSSMRRRLEKKSLAPKLKACEQRKQCFAEVSCGYDQKTAHEQAERCLHCGSLIPSALIKREQPKKTIIPWDEKEALRLWSKRHPESGEELPDVIDDIQAVLQEPDPETFARGRLVLKPATSAEKLIYTTDDE